MNGCALQTLPDHSDRAKIGWKEVVLSSRRKLGVNPPKALKAYLWVEVYTTGSMFSDEISTCSDSGCGTPPTVCPEGPRFVDMS